MTPRELLAALLRRWYVVLLGAVLSGAVLLTTVDRAPVYWTQFNIVLVGPAVPDRPNYLDDPVYGLQPLIGVLATRLNDGHPPLLTGDVSATMVGTGQREGVQVRTPNLGTQWRPVFSANYLDVQVAGPTPEAVSADAARVTRDVDALVREIQDDLDVPGDLRARAVPSSPEPIVQVVAGSRVRAAAGTGLVGVALTLLAVHRLERWRGRRVRPSVGRVHEAAS